MKKGQRFFLSIGETSIVLTCKHDEAYTTRSKVGEGAMSGEREHKSATQVLNYLARVADGCQP